MKSHAKRLLEQINLAGFSSAGNSDMNADQIKKNLQKKLSDLLIKGISVDDVSYDSDGNIYVDFSDSSDNYLSVVFSYDSEEGAQALIVGDSKDLEALIVELDSLSPPVISTQYGEFLNFMDCTWLNKSTLLTLLNAGDFSVNLKQPASLQYDTFGNRIGQPAESYLDEATSNKTVTRGGKRVRLPVLRRKKLERLTYQQKMAKHRSETKSRPGRHRKTSLKIA